MASIEKILNIKVQGLESIQKILDNPFKKDLLLDAKGGAKLPEAAGPMSKDSKNLEQSNRSLAELVKLQKQAVSNADKKDTTNTDELASSLSKQIAKAKSDGLLKSGAVGAPTPAGAQEEGGGGMSALAGVATAVAMGTGVGAVAVIAGKAILETAKKVVNFSSENLEKRATFQTAALKEGMTMSGAFIAEAVNKGFMRNINIGQQLTQTQATKESLNRYQTAALLGMDPEEFKKGDNVNLYIKEVEALKKITAGQDAAFIAPQYKELLSSLGFQSFQELHQTDTGAFASRYYRLNKQYGSEIEARDRKKDNIAALDSEIERQASSFAKDQALSGAANMIGRGWNDVMTSLNNNLVSLIGTIGGLMDSISGFTGSMKETFTEGANMLTNIATSSYTSIKSFLGIDSSSKQDDTNNTVN